MNVPDVPDEQETQGAQQITSESASLAPSSGTTPTPSSSTTPPPFNHALHIFLSFITMGLWLPFYSVMYWKQHD